MKELIKLTNVSYEVAEVSLFKACDVSVKQGDIIGVIGKNGAGKTTLLKLLSQKTEPTCGKIQWLQANLTTVLVEQELESYSINCLPYELVKIWPTPNRSYELLSGGEKVKTRLADGFSTCAAILLLDEPTNHLDKESTDQLIERMKREKRTIIFVSHDRYFLDAVATKIWSIEEKTLIEHVGNYSSYMEERRVRRLTQQRAYEKQQKKKARIEGQLTELAKWSKKAHGQSTKKEGFKEYYRVKAKRKDAQIKSKRIRLESELEKEVVVPVEEEYRVDFSLTGVESRGKRLIEIKNLSKAYNKEWLFQNLQLTVQRGEKLAIIGPNGSGKTTLLRIIAGQETATGDVWISPSAKIGFLTQDVFDLPLDQTAEQFFYQESYKERGNVQNLMKHLGFLATQWKEPLKNMSMGERVKCKLMKFMLEEKDVLILDEPTNHLDLPSREQLEETLALYKGTLLVVSHDQYFLEKTTEAKWLIQNQSMKEQRGEPITSTSDNDNLLLTLEAERLEILGKLSFMMPHDEEYAELDHKFKELSSRIKYLSNQS
ncbi:ABC-F type ribosomal protection protein [Cytobacillus spongiae]|uniref:ribosomal protection-like ABC-F family protein n=1 Tax=Cytobacillus spongiae TaxID=2901381 RepID=UPI001F1D887D|nr:ABC-F type ribosomal protection protein [Cytobacillus spongiae]UII54763.1 ABC-F type ribosomal protection protein [Cytobacillus spongiae]